jgi:hypothetical protein
MAKQFCGSLFASDNLSTVNSIGASTARHAGSIRPSPSTATGVSSSGSVAVPAATPSTSDAGKDGVPSGTQQQASQTPGAVAASGQHAAGGATLTPAPSAEGGKLTWSGTGGASIASQRRLEVGDMIEVRVWDPIPIRDRHQSPGGVSGVFRKRSAASVHSTQSSTGSGSSEAQKSGGMGKATKCTTGNTSAATTPAQNNSTIATATNTPGASTTTTQNTTTRSALEAVASNLARKLGGATNPSASSMAYSEFSASDYGTVAETPTPTPPVSTQNLAASSSQEDGEITASPSLETGKGSTRKEDTGEGSLVAAAASSSLPTSPMPPTKNILTMPQTTGKPPAGSRGRSNTSDVASLRLPNSFLPKPPLQPRASTHGESFAAYEARKQQRSSKPIHHRELSDMTADSMFLPPASAAGTHPLHHNGINSSGANMNPLDFSVPLGVDLVCQDEDDDENDEEDEEDHDSQEDDILSQIGKTHTMRFSFAMLVTEKTLTSLKGTARTQVSMLRQVADLYKLSPYDMVTINRIEKVDEAAVLSAVSADFVLVSIKDQFISRGDMHLFQNSILGSWIYEGQRLTETAKVRVVAQCVPCATGAVFCTLEDLPIYIRLLLQIL